MTVYTGTNGDDMSVRIDGFKINFHSSDFVL